MPSSRSSPLDGYSTGRRHTRISPNIWRKGQKCSTSSAAILFCFTAGTLIPHASPSLQTGGGACEHPTAPFARPGLYKRIVPGGVTESEGQEGANGVGSGIGVGVWNGDGNGDVNGHGDGDVNGHGDGDGAGTGTGVEVNEGAQDGNGDGSGNGDGDGGGDP